MKKYIVFLLIICFISPFLFPQTMNNGENKEEIKTFDVKDLINVEMKFYDNVIENVSESKLILYYYSMYKEVRIQFSCPYNRYNEGDAIIAIRDIMLDFIKEKGFYHYSRLANDIIKFEKNDNDIVFITYFAHFKIYK